MNSGAGRHDPNTEAGRHAGLGAKRYESRGRNRQRGLALVTVIMVLVALALIATPFAVSMRNLESSALLGLRREQARAGAELAVAAAARHLEDTHPFLDIESPHVDRRDELAPDDLEESYPDMLSRDPRGAVRSVTIKDESGKIHLGTASMALLGNLLGGRTVLSESLGEQDGVAMVVDSRGFAGAGLALVDREQFEYSTLQPSMLGELTRGYTSANVGRSVAAMHSAGTEVYDARLVLLVQRGWHIQAGTFTPFTRVDGLKDLGLFAEMTYDADTLDRMRPYLTVHRGAPAWRNAQRLLSIEQLADGSVDLLVADGSHFGQGSVLRLEAADGTVLYDLVTEAVRIGDVWSISVLEGEFGRGWAGDTIVSSLAPVPVNVNSADRTVLVALVEKLGRQPVVDVITDEEAVHIAVLSQQWSLSPAESEFSRLAEEDIERGSFSRADVTAAGRVFEELRIGPGELRASEVAIALAGRRTTRQTSRIGPGMAAHVADLIVQGEPGSHEELRSLLDVAVIDGTLKGLHRNLVLRNAVDSYDAELVGGTAPFCYASDGIFSLTGSSSENNRDGSERARAHVRQVVSVAPPGESARLLSTQVDFEAARRSGDADDGWASYPNLLATGGGPAALVTLDQLTRAPRSVVGSEEDTSLGDLVRQRALADGPVGRAATLLADRPGPSSDEVASYLTPRPVRSALPGTIHFDEGAFGLTGSSPSGWETAAGPLRLDPHAVAAPIVSSITGKLQPFTVEFWFELDDITAETILFDAGADALEDRVVLMMKQGELILRVSDTSFADVEASLPEGGMPPAGEIRYGFDDGLELVAGVPYHVAAWIGGAKDTRLALFIDGVSRGRRQFTTRLTTDLDAAGGPFMGSNAGQGKQRVAVESAAGFPGRGVLRVGNEIMEYTSHDEDSFLVTAAGSTDPFGGRGKRGSAAVSHEASEIVELLGYSIPLAARTAMQGNGILAGDLGPFAVAELDPDNQVDAVEIDPVTNFGLLGEPWQIGTGLGPDTTNIPVRAVGGGALPAGTFQAGGGYALLFNDLGFNKVVGQTITAEPPYQGLWTIPATTIQGSPIGGAEVIYYASYSNNRLTGVSRGGNGGVPTAAQGEQSELNGKNQAWVRGGGGTYSDNRVFITQFTGHAFSELSTLTGAPEYPRTVVIPISVGISDGLGAYEGYHPQLGADSFLVQIGLDFPEAGGGTEWVRWNTATTGDILVRDDGTAVENMLRYLSSNNGISSWNPLTSINQGDLNAMNGLLGFRGQDGTFDSLHLSGEQVLPVICFGEWGISDFGAVNGVPGRNDFVTLVSYDGAREWNVINHAVFGDRDYPNSCLVAFRQAVVDDFLHNDFADDDSHKAVDLLDFETALEEGESGARMMEELELSNLDALQDAIENLAVESRRITRLIKAPSGELPGLPPGQLHLGENFDRVPSFGRATIDELRFHVAKTPGPLVLPTARYVLAQDLEFDEDSVLVLRLTEMHFTHGRLRAKMLGPERLETIGELPPTGGLLLMGDEIVSYAGYDHLDQGAVFLAGRGLYGTERAHHPRLTPVAALTFWPAAPLAEAMGEDDDLIIVADTSLFPERGGLLRIDDELLAYDVVEQTGLSMPTSMGRRPVGLLRGRFGTQPAAHRASSIVRWQPTRLSDRRLPFDDVPEAQAGRFTVNAPGAFFTDLALKVDPLHPAVELLAEALLDGGGEPGSDSETEPRRVEIRPSRDVLGQYFGQPMHHADRLELVLGVRWLPGAFDPQKGASNGWKLGPVVRDVVVRHLQPSLVLEHEEWR